MYEKKLYDVVRAYIKDDMQYFYCVNDFKEEKILEQIQSCTASHLDYVNSAHGSGWTSSKLFTQENFFSDHCMNNLPQAIFVFYF